MRSPAEAPVRAGEATSTGRDADDGAEGMVKAGLRALKALEPQRTSADRVGTALALELAGHCQPHEAAKVLGQALKQMGSTSAVDGPFLARTANSLVKAGNFFYSSLDAMTAASTFAREAAPEGRYKTAFRDLGRLLPFTAEVGYSPYPSVVFQNATDQLATGVGDPVETVVREISGYFRLDPLGVLEDVMARRAPRALENTPLNRELLAVLAEDGPTPEMRSTARFIHGVMGRSDAGDAMARLREAMEIEKMARAAEGVGLDAGPDAIELEEDQVQIGGIVIPRRVDDRAGKDAGPEAIQLGGDAVQIGGVVIPRRLDDRAAERG